jgi:perosamine synthetase
MIRADTIPRFALPYGLVEFGRALPAIFDSGLPSPEPFAELLGPGAKFWTGSGRQALWLILKALQLPPGAGVAVPLFNDLSVITAVAEAGFTPIFIDVDQTLTMDPESLAAAKGRFQAMVPIHLFGNVARLPPLREAAGPVPFVEDTAHAPLSMIHGQRVGVHGAGSFYSFASTKYWPAGGGGLAVVNEPGIAARVAAMLSTFPRPSRFGELRNLLLQGAKAFVFRPPLYGTLGMALRSRLEKQGVLEPRLSRQTIQHHQAIVALHQARRFREIVTRQRENSLYLLSLLEPAEGVVLPLEWPGATYNYHIFGVLLADPEEREAVCAHMLARGVDTSRIYHNIVDHARSFGYCGGCPFAESVPRRLLTLPNYASLSRGQIERVAEVFLDGVARHRSRAVAQANRRRT